MEPGYPNQNNEAYFLRHQSKRSQTMINSTVFLHEMVPRLRPKDIMLNHLSPLVLFSPSNPDKIELEPNDILNIPYAQVIPVNDIPQEIYQKSELDFNSSTITASTNSSIIQSLTPVLKKRDSILVRLEKKRRATVA